MIMLFLDCFMATVWHSRKSKVTEQILTSSAHWHLPIPSLFNFLLAKYLHCFQIRSIMDEEGINFHLKVFVWTQVITHLNQYQVTQLLGYIMRAPLFFLNCQILSQSAGPLLLHTSPQHLQSEFWLLTILTGVPVPLYCFNFQSLNDVIVNIFYRRKGRHGLEASLPVTLSF